MKNEDIALLVGELRGELGGLADQMDKVNKKLDGLPCAANVADIKELKKWKGNCNGEKSAKNLESFKGMISLRNAIVLIVCSNAFSIFVALVLNYFLIGKP